MSRAGRLALLIALLSPAIAQAAPPSNDAPGAAAVFEPYTADNGTPREQQGAADLAEATADGGVPRCLGRLSFERTVWFRVPEAPGPQEITVEAMGRTTDVVDLAAFVQAEVPAPPPPASTPPPARSSQAPVQTIEPNACFGLGSGGADAAEEPTSGLTLRVPARHPVLVQVGRRGPAGNPDDERALLSLAVDALAEEGAPPGDRADRSTPRARNGSTVVALTGASITGEDPAQPACPSLGTVWRKFVPGRAEKRLISVSGSGAETLTVFTGSRPTAGNARDCVVRERTGRLEMAVPVRRRQNVWIRIGTDRPVPGAQATISVQSGERATVIDGGPGGFDPTPGGPGGGFPEACTTTRIEKARVSGSPLVGPAGAFNRFRRVPLAIRVRGASVCDAELRLFGPKGRLFAQGRAVRLAGRTRVELPRLRTFKPGRYRLAVSGVNLRGVRVQVRTTLTGRLR